ncbi:MAG TPA: amidohydrolase [Vicinamibacteria bacterium]|nr:amidohydrolase [Vicinamibacteria bacterium]
MSFRARTVVFRRTLRFDRRLRQDYRSEASANTGSRGTLRTFFAGAFILALGACRLPPESADLVIRGGTVYMMNEARSWAESVAISAGQIVFVGADEDVDAFVGSETRVVSLDGEMVLPGFHDSHVHLVTGGVELGQCNLNGLESRLAVLEAIESCAREASASDWIVGGGWDLPLFPDANPHRQELDRIAPDQAVYLSSADGHSAWVNSKALALAGIDRNTPDPVNGRIEHDEAGEPSGTLREAATGLIERNLPRLSEDDYARGLKRGLAMANQFGITSVIEANGTDPVLAAYERLARSGELTARVRVSLSIDETRDETQVDELLAKRAHAGRSEFLRADAAKIFADGVIEAHTAALLEPYVGSSSAGQLEIPRERLQPLVARLDREGFQVHFHAIGDRAIRESLDALEEARRRNGIRDSRHHIAHIELFHPDDIPRFQKLGVVANFQPLWAYADRYITDLTEPFLGPERSRWLYPIKTVVDSGAVAAAGSDWSVSSMNPLDAIQVALTRKGLSGEGESWISEERVDLPTMLRAYTEAGAYLQHHDDRTGSIEVGKAADIIILEKNLFDVPQSEIAGVEVLLTILGGKEVYRDERFSDVRSLRRESSPR